MNNCKIVCKQAILNLRHIDLEILNGIDNFFLSSQCRSFHIKN